MSETNPFVMCVILHCNEFNMQTLSTAEI